MRVEVRGRGIEVSEALRQHVQRRVRFALDRLGGRVEVVRASLRDVNGSERRGVDKECRIAVVLHPAGSVTARARRADLYQAVDVAAGVAGRSVVRALLRRRTRSRQPPKRPAWPPEATEWSAP